MITLCGVREAHKPHALKVLFDSGMSDTSQEHLESRYPERLFAYLYPFLLSCHSFISNSLQERRIAGKCVLLLTRHKKQPLFTRPAFSFILHGMAPTLRSSLK